MFDIGWDLFVCLVFFLISRIQLPQIIPNMIDPLVP